MVGGRNSLLEEKILQSYSYCGLLLRHLPLETKIITFSDSWTVHVVF